MSNLRRIQLALAMVLGVILAGTIGYIALGFGVLDAVYQTVTTITTVGFREVHQLDSTGKVFTIVLILAGVGTALYAFSVFKARRWSWLISMPGGWPKRHSPPSSAT